MISDKTANVLIGVVTVMWALNIVAGMARINDYEPSESVNGIFMAIVGGAFALRAKAKADVPKSKKKKPAQDDES